ncbi:Uncharacterized protein Rs2_16122 [Raphanus sativus]|nr:Uncharacterized protein Rs2_16122 [Raphanus sativus]
MKRPIEDVVGSDAAEAFYKGKNETKQHYRALLRTAKEQRQSETEWHQASSKVDSIAAKIELLEAIIKAEGNFDFVAELEKLTAEHVEAEGDLADVRVIVPDWYKLDEPWMLDE